MKVLVTGGAGFIGSHVVDDLLAQGHEVRILDKLVDQVHGGVTPAYLPEEAELQVGDMTDRDAVARALDGVDQVVHLAAEVGVGQSMYEISRYVDANTAGTGVMLDVIVNDHIDVSKIVVASSMSIYGEGLYRCPNHDVVAPRLRTEAQLREHRWELTCPDCSESLTPVPTAETKPLFPTSVYAISKMDQELLCLSVGAAYGIDITAVRYFNAYGPRQALSNPYTGVAAIFSGRLLNGKSPLVMEDGQQKRDFIHVKDVARATVLALTAERASGQAINVGVGDPISITEVATTLAKTLGKDIEPEVTGDYRAGDIRHCWADPSVAAELLDFEPEYRFREKGVAGARGVGRQPDRRGPGRRRPRGAQEARAHDLMRDGVDRRVRLDPGAVPSSGWPSPTGSTPCGWTSWTRPREPARAARDRPVLSRAQRARGTMRTTFSGMARDRLPGRPLRVIADPEQQRRAEHRSRYDGCRRSSPSSRCCRSRRRPTRLGGGLVGPGTTTPRPTGGTRASGRGSRRCPAKKTRQLIWAMYQLVPTSSASLLSYIDADSVVPRTTSAPRRRACRTTTSCRTPTSPAT